MPTILLETTISAPVTAVFDLARNIDFHQKSATGTNETAIAGRTSGLIELNETVTWRAKHFGIYQKLTVKITAMERPNMFVDEMVSGAFRSMKHIHTFKETKAGTLMTDEFSFESPLGILGKLVNGLILEDYMKRFLMERNRILKTIAER